MYSRDIHGSIGGQFIAGKLTSGAGQEQTHDVAREVPAQQSPPLEDLGVHPDRYACARHGFMEHARNTQY